MAKLQNAYNNKGHRKKICTPISNKDKQLNHKPSGPDEKKETISLACQSVKFINIPGQNKKGGVSKVYAIELLPGFGSCSND